MKSRIASRAFRFIDLLLNLLVTSSHRLLSRFVPVGPNSAYTIGQTKALARVDQMLTATVAATTAVKTELSTGESANIPAFTPGGTQWNLSGIN